MRGKKVTSSPKPLPSGSKGFRTEELVRRYFLQAGFYVVRGVKLDFDGDEITDIDLWIYERSANLARRRTIVDIKDKQKPQAAERLLFVLGLSRLIGVEGAGVATTDNRPGLRELARKNKALWINGQDLQRLKSSKLLVDDARLSEEEIFSLFAELDQARGSKLLQQTYERGKGSLADRFGIQSGNLCLDGTVEAASASVRIHPGSYQSNNLARLVYVLASMAALSFDYLAAETALRPTEERIRYFADAVRYGSERKTFESRLSWLEKAIATHGETSPALARKVSDGIRDAASSDSAVSLAEIIVKLSNEKRLFDAATQLESAAFSRKSVSYTGLDGAAASFLGAVLDYARIERRRFVDASNE